MSLDAGLFFCDFYFAQGCRPIFSSCWSCPSDSGVAGYTSGGSFGNFESVTCQPFRARETGISNRSPVAGAVASRFDKERRGSPTVSFQDFSTRTVPTFVSSTTAVKTSVAERICSRFRVTGFAVRYESTPSPISHKLANATDRANRFLAEDSWQRAVLFGESIRTSKIFRAREFGNSTRVSVGMPWTYSARIRGRKHPQIHTRRKNH